ncbi:MAG TPA: 1,4-dihydroxy-2-naphthoate polyprenyltransferase [Microthrixaceae bacterium]|nr:1,4-dihydroxy-2-naphthoate polyprenyltransferase [Microthrixaceae bacterium]HNI33928.1 1,4-dihydroxy-2-naphthoate polyprenyltransferase [Microthrixaceae bacterium]
MAQNRWVLGARPRTLPAAVVPVLVGTACAWEAAGERHAQVDWLNVVLAMIVALALQVATNYANDYSDGKRGTDDPSKRVGPPRLVGNGLATADEVKSAMLLAFGVSGLAGGVLALRVGWELIPVGVAAILAGYLYTGGPKPYGYLGLGEAFVFVFFGVVATVGSTYVQVERVTWLSVGCSVMVGSLATALLVVNNLRDIPGDTISGKRTLAVKLGDQRTRILYCVLLTLPFLVLPIVAGLGGRPVASLAFAAVMVAGKPVQAVLGGAKGAELIPVLGATGKVQMAFGVLLTVGLIISTYI